MRKLILAVILAASTMMSQTVSPPSGGGATISSYTTSGLPSSGITTGTLAIVTDASSAGLCNSGGGTSLSLCRWSGAAWTTVGGSGGSGTVINTYTVSTLPASPANATIAFVTDANPAGSCTVGGGTGHSVCQYQTTASAWQTIGAVIDASAITTGTISTARGGTGSGAITGIRKANGASADTAAVAGTDYVAATVGSAVQKASGAGGLTAATAGTDFVVPSGNIATATALASAPTQCGSNQFAAGILASGNAAGCAAPFALTTTGTSGTATFAAGTLNIPQYTGASGGSPGGSTLQPQFNNAGAFGGESNTTVIQGGTGALAATTFAAGTTYLITANDTESVAVAISVSNVTIQCQSGVKITRSTASTDLFDISGDNVTIQGCILDGNSQNGGILAKITGSHAAITSNTLQNAGTNSNSGWIQVSGGSQNSVSRNTILSSVNDIGIAFQQGTNVGIASGNDCTISSSTSGIVCVLVNQPSGVITGVTVSNNQVSVTAANGGCLASLGQVAPGAYNVSFIGNTCNLTGITSFGFRMFGCDDCSINSNTFNANGYTYGNGGAIYLGDLYDSSVSGNSAFTNAGDLGQALICTDCARDAITGNAFGGFGSGTTGINGSAQSDAILINTVAGTCSDLSIIGNKISIVSTATIVGIHIVSGSVSGDCSRTIVSGNNIRQFGTAAATAIKIEQASGAVDSNTISNNSIIGTLNGIVTTTGTTNTRVLTNSFSSVGTNWSFGAATYLMDTLNGVTFSSKPANVAAGSMVYLTDANSTCGAGSSTGNTCFYNGSIWSHGGNSPAGSTNAVQANGGSGAFGDSGCTASAGAMTCSNFTASATTPGADMLVAGTGSISALPASSGGFAAPASGGTSYLFKLPATASAGLVTAAAPATGDGVNESALSFTALPLASASLAVVNTRRTCDIAIGDESTSSAIANAQLGPQKRICYIPAAATIVEMDVSADAGTPNVIVGKNHAGTVLNVVSAALATASSGGIACANTGGTTGIDGATTCAATLQNTSVAAGDYLELVSGTAGGTAKLMTVHVVYTIN